MAATFKSNQITNATASPVVLSNPGEFGKVRAKYFSWTGDAAQNNTVHLMTLPKGSSVLHGRVAFTDFGSSVTMDIGTAVDGVAVDEDHWAAAIDVATAAGQSDFANTLALYGLGSEVLTAETEVWAKFEAANPDSGTIKGYILYIGPNA